MDPNLWTGLKSSQSSSRAGVPSGAELTLSLQPSLSQPAINNAVEIFAFLDRQRLAAASGLAASLLPQPAILTPSYSGNASYGAQYATTNSLYHYNGFPVAQPLLTTSYDSSSLLASQQLAASKNSNLAAINQYKIPIQSHLLNVSNCSASSTAAPHSSKSATVQRAKKPTGIYSFTGDQHSRHVNDIQKSSSYESSSLGARMDGSRMLSPTHASPISCSMSQNDFMSSDMTFSHMLDSVTSPQSTVSHSATSQTSSRHAARHSDASRLILHGSEFGLESLTGNSGLDLSQFSKHDTSSKPYSLTEMNFPSHEFSMSNTDNPLAFSHHCDIMNANKESSNLNSAQTGHSQQQSKQHSSGVRSSPMPWSTTAQFCEQQEASSMHTSMAGLTSNQSVAYEAVSPPPPSEVQSFSFIDSLHLYQPEGMQAKDLLTSTYELGENHVYLKNLVSDMPLLYATQPSSDGSSHLTSGLAHSLTVPIVASSGNNNLGNDKTKQPVGNACAMRQTTGDHRDNATDRCKRQKAKANTEVGVVLPMPQNKLSKQMSSNPLLAQYDLLSGSVDATTQLQQQCAYEATLQYGSSSMPSLGQVSLQNYKVDISQKLTSPDASGLAKHTAFGSSVANRNELPSDAHNSPIVLTNITGNVYVNQYTMLQPGSIPLVNQDMSMQTMARYEQMMKTEPEKPEQKSCSVLLVPNENDDEFGHLSIDPIGTKSAGKAGNATDSVHGGSSLSTLHVPITDPNVVPKQKVGISAFESSYMSFVQGHKSETLSSVTNSPIKNRPVLPKYIPETRRPRTDSNAKTGSEGDESSSSSRKPPLTLTSSGSSSDAAPKNSGTETVVTDTNPSNSQTDSGATVVTLSSTSTTKFPAKFSHKLQGRANISGDIAKTDSSIVQGKDKCEVTKEFKWKKMLNAEPNEAKKQSNSLKPDVPMPSVDQGTKRRLSSSIEPLDGAKSKDPKTQWTVSKKSKLIPLAKNESAEKLPILVIRAVPGSSKDADKKHQSSNVKSNFTKPQNSSSSTVKKPTK